MVEKARKALAGVLLVAALVAAALVPLRGLTPVVGLVLLGLFLVALAAKPEPGDARYQWPAKSTDPAAGPSRGPGPDGKRSDGRHTDEGRAA